MGWLPYIVEKLWPVFLAVMVTQWVAQRFIEQRKPKLELVPEGVQPNTWKKFDGSLEENYHMWRINVRHIKIPWYLTWIISGREPALYCKAHLTFYDKGMKLFIMQGRWANTPEPSLISNGPEKIIYPDTIEIGYHDEAQPLDCIIKFDAEKVIYGWNNESYATGARNPNYKLEAGRYEVDVKLSAPNIRGFTTRFNIIVSEDWEKSSLTLA
jgi:hypothetical protein